MPVVARRFLRRSGSEESIQWESRPSCASAPSLSFHPMPFRITQQSYRPRVSDRTMVGALPTRSACKVSGVEWRRHDRVMKYPKWRQSDLAYRQKAVQTECSTECPGNPNGGAGCARNFTASGRGQKMPLDIPFYRTFPQLRRRVVLLERKKTQKQKKRKPFTQKS